ncbi:MAG: DNA polymerase IV, partial [Sphingomonas bacterium]|nr:DNA polymerase IV [Sphingomonas bacterium]
HGVGPVTAKKMESLGILTGADLRARPLAFLARHFGSHAEYLYGAARGEDHRPVRVDRPTRSVGAERTFETNLTAPADLDAALIRVADAAWIRIERSGAEGKTVTLKLRHADFRTITRARTLGRAIADRAEFLAIGRDLLVDQLPVTDGARLLGLTLSGIVADDKDLQPTLPL